MTSDHTYNFPQLLDAPMQIKYSLGLIFMIWCLIAKISALRKISHYAVYTVHKTLHYNYNYISRKL